MSKREIIIAPSVLAADFMDLSNQFNAIQEGGATLLHFDVMDGVFVPNISLGGCVLQSIRKKTDLVLDVHLMITNPIRYIEDFRKAGADYITVHVEAVECLTETIEAIKASGAKAGISVKPKTSFEDIEEYIDKVDMVLVMTVEPGFGGQSFMTDMMEKVSKIRDYINSKGLDVHLQVDGGIASDTIGIAADAGANCFVAGSSVFGSPDISGAVRDLLNKVNV